MFIRYHCTVFLAKLPQQRAYTTAQQWWIARVTKKSLKRILAINIRIDTGRCFEYVEVRARNGGGMQYEAVVFNKFR